MMRDNRKRLIAAAIANARGMRRGVPPIVNVLDILPAKLRDEVLDDAENVLRELERAQNCDDSDDEEEGLGEPCEGCTSPAVTRDTDGVPLCGACYDALDVADDAASEAGPIGRAGPDDCDVAGGDCDDTDCDGDLS